MEKRENNDMEDNVYYFYTVSNTFGEGLSDHEEKALGRR